jgi:hypothetical protein
MAYEASLELVDHSDERFTNMLKMFVMEDIIRDRGKEQPEISSKLSEVDVMVHHYSFIDDSEGNGSCIDIAKVKDS